MVGEFFLTSEPSPLEGNELCLNMSIQLRCEANDSTDDVLRWFASTNLEGSMISLAAVSIAPSLTAPQLIPMQYSVPGIEIYLDRIQYNLRRKIFSTLHINTSVYYLQELYYIRCGNFNSGSDWISLNFSIQCKTNNFIAC